MFKKAKSTYYNDLINASESNTLWASLRKILPGKSKVTIDTLNIDNVEVKDTTGIATAFNSFFTTVGAKLAAKFQNTVPTTATHCREHFRFRVVEADQVSKLLKGLSVNKAQGLDNIPAKILKTAAPELAFPLATIFNYSLMTGTIPGEWKCGKVTPIYKDGDKQDLQL